MATINFDSLIKQIDEGLFDRAKANVAGAVGAVKGLGARASGTLGAAKAAFSGNTAGAQVAAQKAAAGKQMGLDAKTQSIVNSHQNKITKAVDDFTRDLNKLNLSDPNSVNQLKQTLNTQVQNAVKAPAAATSTATPTTSTSSGVPANTTATSSSTATGSSAGSSPSTSPSTSGSSASTSAPAAPTPPASGVPTATITPGAPASSSPTTPASLANPESVKAVEAKLKDLGNQEKILKGLMSSDKKNASQYVAQLQSLEAAKQAAVKEKQAAQAALKKAASATKIDAYKQKQQASGMNLSAKPNLTNASFIPTGTVFSELFDKLTNGLKPHTKYKLLS